MKIDYLMMTEAGIVLAEESENRTDENMERCRHYAGEIDAGSEEMRKENGSVE